MSHTNLGLWAEYFYIQWYTHSVPLPANWAELVKEITTARSQGVVPYDNTQYGMLRVTDLGHNNLGYVLHLSNPGIYKAAQAPSFWEIGLNGIPTIDTRKFCISDATHSECCFLNLMGDGSGKWLKGHSASSTQHVDIFTSQSPCYAATNKGGEGTLQEAGCTEALIQFCKKHPHVKFDVYFYIYYRPQNSGQGVTREAIAKDYKAFLAAKTTGIPANLSFWKVDYAKRIGGDKWWDVRPNLLETCGKIH